MIARYAKIKKRWTWKQLATGDGSITTPDGVEFGGSPVEAMLAAPSKRGGSVRFDTVQLQEATSRTYKTMVLNEAWLAKRKLEAGSVNSGVGSGLPVVDYAPRYNALWWVHRLASYNLPRSARRASLGRICAERALWPCATTAVV